MLGGSVTGRSGHRFMVVVVIHLGASIRRAGVCSGRYSPGVSGRKLDDVGNGGQLGPRRSGEDGEDSTVIVRGGWQLEFREDVGDVRLDVLRAIDSRSPIAWFDRPSAIMYGAVSPLIT